MLKLKHNYTQSHVSKVMIKILQARLQQYVNWELADVQNGFRKAEEPEIKLPTSLDNQKSKKIPENIYFCFIDYVKVFVQIRTNSGKFSKRWEYQTTLPASWDICMQVRKQQLYWNSAYLTYKKSTSW